MALKLYLWVFISFELELIGVFGLACGSKSVPSSPVSDPFSETFNRELVVSERRE